MTAEDSVCVSVVVKADSAAAFRVFTERTDAWWKRGEQFRMAGVQRGSLQLEPFLYGRLFEAFEVDGVTRVVRIGRIETWEPPHRIAFEWRAVGCKPNERTKVEVTFAAHAEGTLVTLTNRGFQAVGLAHLSAESLQRHWEELLRSYAALAGQ